MPCKSLSMKSPYQIVFQNILDIKNLTVFCTAVYPLLRPFNHNKLEPRSTQCVFLGFALGNKGVICCDIKTRKFILSKHVIRDEDIYLFKQVSTQKNFTTIFQVSDLLFLYKRIMALKKLIQCQ